MKYVTEVSQNGSIHTASGNLLIALAELSCCIRELGDTFCMNKCQQRACVTVEDEFFSLSPDTVDEFSETKVLPNV